MHRNYGGIPDGVPLNVLVKMIEQGLTWDLENEIKPLWYLRVIKDALTGQDTTVTIGEMIKEATTVKVERSGDDITADFMKIIERHNNG